MTVNDIEAKLPDLIQEAEHSEIWSISLATPSLQRTLVLNKYLTAHKGDADAAAAGILATLKWRKEFDPVAQVKATHNSVKFGALGFITELEPEHVTAPEAIRPGGGGRKAVVTWNLYGRVDDHDRMFADVDEFLRWRVGLMERGVQALRLTEEGLPPPTNDIAIVQVHDYLGVSMLRPNPLTRATTKKTVELLAAHYPELLSRKYFVNVPIVMSFMFTLFKAFVAKETVAKFQVISWGVSLVGELGEDVPKAYGGKGLELEEQDLGRKSEAAEPTPSAPGQEKVPNEGGKDQAGDGAKEKADTVKA